MCFLLGVRVLAFGLLIALLGAAPASAGEFALPPIEGVGDARCVAGPVPAPAARGAAGARTSAATITRYERRGALTAEDGGRLPRDVRRGAGRAPAPGRAAAQRARRGDRPARVVRPQREAHRLAHPDPVLPAAPQHRLVVEERPAEPPRAAARRSSPAPAATATRRTRVEFATSTVASSGIPARGCRSSSSGPPGAVERARQGVRSSRSRPTTRAAARPSARRPTGSSSSPPAAASSPGSTTSHFGGGLAAVDQRPGPGDGDAGAQPRRHASSRSPQYLRVARRARRRVQHGRPARRARPRGRGQPLPHLLVRLRPAGAQRVPPVARRPLRLRRGGRRRPGAGAVPRRRPAARARRSPATTPARGRSTARAATSPTSATTACSATSSRRCATARRRASTAATADRFTRYMRERARLKIHRATAPQPRRTASVTFSLSKISCVTLRVRRAGKVVLSDVRVLGRGTRTLTWMPRRRGDVRGRGPGRRPRRPLHARAPDGRDPVTSSRSSGRALSAGFVAAALARAGVPVTVVAREETARAIARDGIEVESVRLGELTAHPRAVARCSSCRSTCSSSRRRRRRSTRRSNACAWSLASSCRCSTASSTSTASASASATRSSPARSASAPSASRDPGPASSTRARPSASSWRRARATSSAFVHSLRTAEIPAKLLDREADVLWSKLVRLNALACTTAAAGRADRRGRARTRSGARGWRARSTRRRRSPRAEGAAVDPAATLVELMELGAGHTSSLHRDLAAGLDHELDAIAGAVMRAGARHGVATPDDRRARRADPRALPCAPDRWRTRRRSPRTSRRSRSRSTPTTARTPTTPPTGSGSPTSTWSGSASTRARGPARASRSTPTAA